MEEEKWTLWSNEKFEIFTPANPHISSEVSNFMKNQKTVCLKFI